MKRDLAKEYAQERVSERKNGNEISFEDKVLFTPEDIENAFNAGRENVVENIPGLIFKENSDGYVAETIFGYRYRINRKFADGVVSFGFSAGLTTPKNYDTSLAKVMEAANEDYRSALRRCFMIDTISDEELEKGLEVKFVPFLNKVRNDMLRNNKSFPIDCGYANGYVAVPPHHPLYGMDYDKVNELVYVHGGLTYSRPYDEKLVSNAILLSEDEVPADSWIFGFDTMHFEDNLGNCSEAFCKSETINLVEQFKKIKL
nr:MAG TPA: hypothetical protein [Caudoviricetes sp.]